ncbi:hypothetical protein ACLOJK_010803 [Asimina triloba]
MEAARVQVLAQKGIFEIPPQYVQPAEIRPGGRAVSDFGVPIVDLHNFDPRLSDDVHQNISRCCRDWGAFQVINHSVPCRLLDEIRAVGSAFFDSPLEEKLRYACDPSSAASEGYGSRMLANDDSVLDWRDYFDHHTLPLSRRNPSHWPEFIPNYRSVTLISPPMLENVSSFFWAICLHE